MDVIQHDVRRLDRLITDISSASRLDAELARNETERIDIVKLLDAVVSMANDVRQPGAADIVLDKPAAGARCDVTGHASRLVQVLNNLIDNATSFSPEGGAVRVGCRRVDDEVVITVDDNGPGIPAHALNRIFERFYTDRPNQGFGQNSGLGLSISKQIVEAHHGDIRAENRTDAAGAVTGARFIVTIPATD